jgi:NarL family two-component system response regulator LiaR
MTETRQIRVLIVDDHALVRSGLKLFLRAFPDLKLVGEAGSGEEALRLCTCTETDVVLMDLMMPGMGGIAATQAIRQQCPQTRVIALTSSQDTEMVQSALRAGAIGYLLKNVSADELAAAIRAADAGCSTLAPEVTQALIEAAARPASTPPEVHFDLTSREVEVLAWLAKGLSNAEIAQRLTVTPETVKFHVSNILSKLGCTNRAEAAVLAVRQGLVPRHTG